MSHPKKHYSQVVGQEQGSLFDTVGQGSTMTTKTKDIEIKILALPEGEVRTTPDKRVSVYDAIQAATGQMNPRQVWDRIKGTNPEVVSKCDSYKFHGRGQLPTPVTNKEGFLYILSLLPGEAARLFREQSAKLVIRYIEADATLAEEIIDQQTDPDVLRRLALRAKSKEIRSVLTSTIKSHGGISENGFSRNTYAQVTSNINYAVLKHKASEVQAYTGQRLTRNLLPAKAGSFHSGATCHEAQACIRVFRPGYFALRFEALLRPQPTS